MLSSKQRTHLKALAHPLKPIVQVGKKGASLEVEKELARALFDHELVKVRFMGSQSVFDDASHLAERANAELVAVLGKNAIMFLQNEEKPRVKLPKT